MSRFDLITQEVHADWWEEGETVVIKERSYYDQQRMAGMSIRKGGLDVDALKATATSNGQSAAESEMLKSFSIEDFSIITMLVSIASWTFEEDGRPVPVTLANIQRLSQRDGDFIMEAITELNPTRDENFPSGRDSGLPGWQGETAS
jgi:hypothetical protein